jgi:hypothetical protein
VLQAGVDESLTRLVSLEANYIGPEYAMHDMGFQRNYRKSFLIRKRGMQEPANSNVDIQLACSLSQKPWKKHQMIILDPDMVPVLQTGP